MRKITKILLSSLLLLPFLFGNKEIKTNAANDIYNQDFSSLDQVNADFEARYVYTLGGSSEEDYIGQGKDSGARWYIEDNCLKRQSVSNDIDASIGTNSIGVVTYKKQKYTNFELTVDYKMGTSTYYWPVIAFRQLEVGKYYLSDGAGAFVQRTGKATLWGTDGVGGPYETKGYATYQNYTWHTLKLVVDGLNFSMYIDNSASPTLKRNLPESIFRKGYISLVSVNNECEFKNLSIKELPVSNVIDTYSQNPSLDDFSETSLLKNAKEVTKIDELSAVQTQSQTIVENKSFFDSKILLFILIGLMIVELSFGFILLRKRK